MDIKKLGKEMLAVLLIGTTAITLAACGKSETKETAAGTDGAKKVITVAHTNYYVPYDYVNEKGESDGL